MTRWERRYDSALAAGDDTAADHALDRFTTAVNNVTERSMAVAAPPPPPPPPEPLDAWALQSHTDDDLEHLHSARVADRAGQELIEREWRRRAMLARDDVDHTAFVHASFTELVDELHYPEELSDDRVRRAWLDSYHELELRELAETEMARRGLDHPTHPGDDYELIDAIDQRLSIARETLSRDEFRQYERTLITDPSHRMPDSYRAVSTRPLRELEAEYDDFLFQRYADAEAACRGHLLNRRGQHLNVDPFTLMSGNAKRMHAYASEEFKGYVGATGGHMSFARFRMVCTSGTYDQSRVEVFADAVSA